MTPPLAPMRREAKEDATGWRTAGGSPVGHWSTASWVLEMASPGEARENKKVSAKALVLASGPFRYLASRCVCACVWNTTKPSF